MKKMKKEYVIALVVLIITAIGAIISVSYAIWSNIYSGTKTNQITTGTLVLVLDDSASAGINLTTAIPVSDADGLATTPYTFTLKNTGTNNAQYRIKLIDDEATYTSDGCSSNKLPWSNIKYSFAANGGSATTALLSTNSGILEEGVLNTGVTNSYTLRLWIDSAADNTIMGKHFNGKIEVDAIVQGKTDYTTGA